MYNKLLTVILAAIILLHGSCSKKIDEAYRNPNADVRVPVESLLPQVITAMAGNYAGHGTMNDARYIGAYIQNWQYSNTLSNYDRMGYTNNVADVSQSTWRMHYYDIGQNNKKMIEWATEEKKWDYVGVGQAIFAWSWLTLTDYYGDVILKDAFNTNLVTFTFEGQEAVYPYVRQLCYQALDNLNKTGDGVSPQNLAKGDISSYTGNTTKWKKFVYGVLARSYNHLSNKSAEYKPDSAIYYANLAMQSNVDDMIVLFPGGSIGALNNFFGPFRGNLAGLSTTAPTSIRQGAYVANLMDGRNNAFLNVQDPRSIYLLRLNAANTFRGVQPNKGQAALAANDRPENFWGVSQTTTNNNTAPSNDLNARFIFRNTSPFPILTATEMHFIKAEANFRKGNKAEALQSYRDGIATHFNMLTTTYNVNIPAGREITAPVQTAFLANPTVVPASAADITLSKIMLQKYIALFGYGVLETWVDMRRYKYNGTDPLNGGSVVYTDFAVPTGVDLFEDNGAGNLVYRVRPRFNAEYVWNLNELRRIGADLPTYHTKEMWFMKP